MQVIAWILLCALLVVSGCGFYVKTYRFKGPPLSLSEGMSEEDLIAQWGNPLSVQGMGPMQVWKYFVREPAYGEKKSYYLVWFQNGHIVKWETREEETVPPVPQP